MKKYPLKYFHLTLIALSLTLLWSGMSPSLAPALDYRIADGKSDNGYPNPFRHYPRGPGYVHQSWVFDTLVWKDKNGIIPALATAWEYDPETLTFTFQIREDVKWHDGNPLNAADVAFTINYFLAHPYKFVSLDGVTEAVALDSHSVAVKLDKPYAAFIKRVAGVLPIIPKHIWENISKPETYDDPKSFIGCGPFIFKNFDKAKGTYLYEAFDAYYKGKAKIDRLIYLQADDPLIALSNGSADLALIKPEMSDILSKKGFVILESANGWNKKLMINHKKAPFNSKVFRQALAHAIDQRELIQKAHRGFGTPASYGLLSIDHEFYNPDTPRYEPSATGSGKLLESLGYSKNSHGFYEKDGKGLTVELLASNISVTGESKSDRDGEVIKQQLERAGIKVNLINQERATTDGRIKNWDFDLAISGHGGLLGDAIIMSRMVSPKSGSVNSARFGTNEKLLKLLKKQSTETDETKRKKLIYQIQEIYADELPAISLYYPSSRVAYNPEKGIDWFFTPGGIGSGIPLITNKDALIAR